MLVVKNYTPNFIYKNHRFFEKNIIDRRLNMIGYRMSHIDRVSRKLFEAFIRHQNVGKT